MLKKLIILFFLFFPIIALAKETPIISAVSSDFISIVNYKSENSTTLAIYGENLSEIIFNEEIKVYLGNFEGNNISGNDAAINVSFSYQSQDVPSGDYNLKVAQGNAVLDEYQGIYIFNPYQENYLKPKLKKFFKKTKKKKLSKRTIGLNVHMAQASDENTDSQYLERLDNSQTKWVREHFSHQQIMGEDQAAWVTRYDQIVRYYKERNIRVVGMLAYDKKQDYTNPSIGAWKKYVRYTVRRYRNYVDVWEIWNEPDSEDYLSPSNMDEYKKILKSGSRLVRYYDPNSMILNGGIANINHHKFLRSLYRRGSKYFDGLAVHLYYADEYLSEGNLGTMKREWESFEKIWKGRKKIWVTELGASLGTAGMTQTKQKKYLKAASKYLLEKKQVRNILLYTLRDRNLADEYEAKFGLVEQDFDNRLGWRWYRRLPKK